MGRVGGEDGPPAGASLCGDASPVPSGTRRYRLACPLDPKPRANRRWGGNGARDRDNRVRSAAGRSVAHRSSAPRVAARLTVPTLKRSPPHVAYEIHELTELRISVPETGRRPVRE